MATERTSYSCSECDYFSPSEGELIAHIANSHAVKDERYFEGDDYYLFEKKEHFDAWVVNFDARRHKASWEGPGWYFIEVEYERVCGNDERILCMYTVDQALGKLRIEAARLTAKAAKIMSRAADIRAAFPSEEFPEEENS